MVHDKYVTDNQSLKKEIYTSIYDKACHVENGKIKLKAIGLNRLSLPLFEELSLSNIYHMILRSSISIILQKYVTDNE